MELDNRLTDALTQEERDGLVNYRGLAHYPERAHPRPDHFMPIFYALETAGTWCQGKNSLSQLVRGDLGMSAYEFSI
jgi:4,5-DOPA dioxygenase extradiol